MKCAVLLIVLTLSANAQSQVDKPSEGKTTVANKIDPKLHDDAIRLVELSGTRQHIQANLEKKVDEEIKDKCQRCTPEFEKETKRLILERINLDDYRDVFVRMYEKYFTDEEINELIALRKDTSKTAVPSPALKEKLTAILPGGMADAIDECTKMGAKLGTEIEAEIEREHPEYMKPRGSSIKP